MHMLKFFFHANDFMHHIFFYLHFIFFFITTIYYFYLHVSRSSWTTSLNLHFFPPTLLNPIVIVYDNLICQQWLLQITIRNYTFYTRYVTSPSSNNSTDFFRGVFPDEPNQTETESFLHPNDNSNYILMTRPWTTPFFRAFSYINQWSNFARLYCNSFILFYQNPTPSRSVNFLLY